ILRGGGEGIPPWSQGMSTIHSARKSGKSPGHRRAYTHTHAEPGSQVQTTAHAQVQTTQHARTACTLHTHCTHAVHTYCTHYPPPPPGEGEGGGVHTRTRNP